MNFKRILVLVMTFAMLLSTFMPTLGVFAEEVNNGHEHESNEKHYVSIGDSMANGYGFDGYIQGAGFNIIENNENAYGVDAYPDQFAEYLASLGYDVEHTKLASSALRAEDLLYLLGGRDEHADDWFEEVLYYTMGEKNFDHVPALSEFYQNAVKDADIITLGVGNASFGAFMLSRVTGAIGVMGNTPDKNTDYTLENALKLLDSEEDKNTIIKIYNRVYNKLMQYVSADVAEQYNLKAVCDIVAYVSAGFIINYAKSIDRIIELNEKENLEIMLVGLMNTTYGMTIALDDNTSIYFGDIMDDVFALLNAYIAAYAAATQVDGEEDTVKFYYASQPQPKFIVQAFDDLANSGWQNVDNGRLSADIVRGRTIRTYNDTLRAMISAGFVAGINAEIQATVEEAVAQAVAEAVSAGVETGVLAAFRENFGVTPDMMSDADFKQYIYNAGYGSSYESEYNKAYNENYPVYYEQALKTELDNRLIKDYYGFLPEITLDDVKAYEANVPAAWNNEYFFMDSTDVKNLAVAVYLGIEDAIVNSINLNEIPLSGLETIAGDITSVFDGFAPSIASPEAVHTDLANFFSSDDLLPLVKIYAIFNIGDGMCVHPTPAGHDDIADEIIKAYETDWTAQKQTIKNTYDVVMEYYDEAYEYGYAYVDEAGYINKVVSIINRVIKRLEIVDLADNTMTEEFRVLLDKEIEATIATLKEIKDVLANDKADDIRGLVVTVRGLMDDALTHVQNIYALCAQAGIDVNQLIILPALAEALVIIETELIPALEELVNEFVDAVIAHVTEKAEELYSELLVVSKEVYNQIIATLVKIQLYAQEKVENAVAPLIDGYFTLVEKLTEIYGTVEEAIRVAGIVYGHLVELNEKLDGALTDAMDKVAEMFVTLYKTYGNVEDALKALNTTLMNIVDTVDGTITSVIAAYNALVAKLYEIYGNVEEALNKANEIYNNIVNTVDYAVEKGLELYNTILNVLANTYGNVKNIVIVAGQIFSYVYDFVSENITPEELEGIYNDIVAIVTEAYGTSKDVYYVAGQVYAYIVNAVEHTFEGNYELNVNSMYVSLGNAVYGEELAEMLNLGDKYYNFGLSDNYLEKVAEADLITIRLDNGEAIEFAMGQLENPTELDWDKYLDAEGQEALDEVLESIKADLIASGKTAELSAMLSDLLGIPAITLTDETIANAVAYAIESALYSYAEFVERFTVVLKNVYEAAPNATVVLTGIQNPLEGISLDAYIPDMDISEYVKAVDFVVAGLNANLVAAAVVREETIFVDSVDAKDIYDALNVYCAHAYDDCVDTECNICGETRVAPGHIFTNYIYNNDAKCEVDGTETALCDVCGAEDTRTATGTALVHEFGDWTVVKEATSTETGLKQRECKHCGAKETEIIPIIVVPAKDSSPWILLVVAGVVIIGALLVTMKKKPVSAEKNAEESTSENEEDNKEDSAENTTEEK